MTKRKMILIALSLLFLGLTVYNVYPEDTLPEGTKIDKLVICKSKRELYAYSNGQLIKIYQISLSSEPVGAKEFEGDKKTPEGLYTINDKNANSSFHKNLGISYPNPSDIEHAKRLGKPTGGDIKIHGLRNMAGFVGKFHRLHDWTLGCIALTNSEIDELYNATEIRTPIEIKQ